ncbi:PIN domain-containing protein [Candidatus Leptofilum sp.]|uniref:PIN domain-containing protein n=1 Tax=Candidatus Leptofilum sp. TaxID=3241576 RepID=UPI003B5BF977
MSDEYSYQFVDTNVLVYAYDSSDAQKQQQAKKLLQQLWQQQLGCLSIQVLQEFFVTVTRKLAKPLTPLEASQIIADLGLWRIHQPQVEDVLSAIQIQQRHQLSFWDGMIIRSASQLGCQIIWTEDLNSEQIIEGCTIQTPFVT